MTTRIKISASEFKVSKPGVNVETATADQLAFDAMNNTSYAGIILQGTSRTDTWASAFATSSPFVQSGSNWYFNPYVTYRRQAQISFPAQSTVPDVLFMVRPLGDPSWATPHYSALYDFGSSGIANGLRDANGALYYFPDSWAGTSVWASASTNTLTLRVDYVQYSSGATAWEFAYLVFQPPKTFTSGSWQDLPTLYT